MTRQAVKDPAIDRVRTDGLAVSENTRGLNTGVKVA